MYEQYFGFREPPFRITPDPRFLYRNAAVEEAAAALSYGIERRKGFLSLVGEAGCGKTTLLRHVLDTLSANQRTVLLLHPTVEFDEILEYILSELGIPIDGGRKLVLLQRLQEFLLEHTRAGGNVALLIDEAQDLEPRVLEELRLLSNLETGTEKILQIVLAGQPELETKLADPSLRQLRQRIALHVRLRPFSADEVLAYVACRLQLAGTTRADVFEPAALARIAGVTQGIPRIINVLCDACLVTAFATGARQVTAAIVDEAWTDYARLAVVEQVGTPVAAPIPPPISPTAPPPVMRVTTPEPEPAPVTEPEPVPALSIASGKLVEWSRRVSARHVVGGIVAVVVAIVGISAFRSRPVDTTDPVTHAAAPRSANGEATGTPSAPEARALVHEYMLAYEARDLDGLVALFVPNAVADGRQGLAAIRADYASRFARLADVTYTVARIAITPGDDRVTISGPILIDYRELEGSTGARHGTAEWEIARENGVARIIGLRSSG